MLKNITSKFQVSNCKWVFPFILFFVAGFQQMQAQDMGVTALVAPITPMCAANNQSVVVKIKNFDAGTIDYNVDTVVVTVEITGASTQTFTDTLYAGTLAFDSTQNVTVTALCDLSTVGTHIFKVYTSVLSSDASGLNDTLALANIVVNVVPATPTITAYGPITFCEGDSVLLVSSSATANAWTGGSSDDSLYVLTSGPYSVTVSNGSCSATSTITTVTANPYPAVPTIAVYDTTVFCMGDSAILVSSSATGNLWTGGSTNDSLTVYASGPYTVTVTSTGCSSTSDTTTITVNPYPAIPTITTSDTVVFCTGSSVILYSSSAIGNSWTGGSTADSIIVATSGPYNVTVTIAGCSSVSADTTVTVNPLPTVTLAPFTTNPCSDDAPFALTGGLPAGGTYSGIGVTAGTTFNPGSAGAVQGITYTYVDPNGCANSASSNMTVVFCTGIEEYTSEGVSVYPNPTTTGIFNIAVRNAGSTEMMISVVDIQGKEVYNALEKNISADYNKQINIMHLSKGIYYIKLSTDADVKIQKLIVE
ncbi:MAG: T9SS type A sorting domain-containing protein [Bacteroidia bacterium]|nr:T9SS type A sorting domain-containing protein [Bacteroidia bacterium]